MADQPSDENTYQILRDLAARLEADQKKREESVESSPEEEVEKDLEQGRFEVLPSNALEEHYSKRASTTGKTKKLDEMAAEVRSTADNYRQMYMDQRVREEQMRVEQEKEIRAAEAKKTEAANKASQEQKIADGQRFRARELQNQIVWWQQQFGQGQYDDATINGTIETLQRELGGIPQGLW
jgi:hypothetical protein